MDTRESNEHNVSLLWRHLLWQSQSSRPTSRTPDRGILSFRKWNSISEKSKLHTMGRNVRNYDWIWWGGAHLYRINAATFHFDWTVLFDSDVTFYFRIVAD